MTNDNYINPEQVDNENQDYTPINKGQFTLEPPERISHFENCRGAGVEKDYQENRELWEKYPKKQFVSDYPLHVDIELASICMDKYFFPIFHIYL